MFLLSFHVVQIPAVNWSVLKSLMTQLGMVEDTITPATGVLREEDHEFEISLGYAVNSI